jgi:hypothetical protein
MLCTEFDADFGTALVSVPAGCAGLDASVVGPLVTTAGLAVRLAGIFDGGGVRGMVGGDA